MFDMSVSLSSSQLARGTWGTVTATLSDTPTHPLEVFWNHTHGQINGSVVTTGNIATANFYVGDLADNTGTVTVSIAGVRKELNYTIDSATPTDSIEFNYAAIASGSSSGTHQVETLEGSISENVVLSTIATVHGIPGDNNDIASWWTVFTKL